MLESNSNSTENRKEACRRRCKEDLQKLATLLKEPTYVSPSKRQSNESLDKPCLESPEKSCTSPKSSKAIEQPSVNDKVPPTSGASFNAVKSELNHSPNEASFSNIHEDVYVKKEDSSTTSNVSKKKQITPADWANTSDATLTQRIETVITVINKLNSTNPSQVSPKPSTVNEEPQLPIQGETAQRKSLHPCHEGKLCPTLEYVLQRKNFQTYSLSNLSEIKLLKELSGTYSIVKESDNAIQSGNLNTEKYDCSKGPCATIESYLNRIKDAITEQDDRSTWDDCFQGISRISKTNPISNDTTQEVAQKIVSYSTSAPPYNKDYKANDENNTQDLTKSSVEIRITDLTDPRIPIDSFLYYERKIETHDTELSRFKWKCKQGVYALDRLLAKCETDPDSILLTIKERPVVDRKMPAEPDDPETLLSEEPFSPNTVYGDPKNGDPKYHYLMMDATTSISKIDSIEKISSNKLASQTSSGQKKSGFGHFRDSSEHKEPKLKHPEEELEHGEPEYVTQEVIYYEPTTSTPKKAKIVAPSETTASVASSTSPSPTATTALAKGTEDQAVKLVSSADKSSSSKESNPPATKDAANAPLEKKPSQPPLTKTETSKLLSPRKRSRSDISLSSLSSSASEYGGSNKRVVKRTSTVSFKSVNSETSSVEQVVKAATNKAEKYRQNLETKKPNSLLDLVRKKSQLDTKIIEEPKKPAEEKETKKKRKLFCCFEKKKRKEKQEEPLVSENTSVLTLEDKDIGGSITKTYTDNLKRRNTSFLENPVFEKNQFLHSI